MLKVGQSIACAATRITVDKGRINLYGQPMLQRGASNLVLTFLFSGAIGTAIPGAIYVSQRIQFKKVGIEKQDCWVQPMVSVKKDLGKNRFLLQTDLKLQDNVLLAEGEAIILYQKKGQKD